MLIWIANRQMYTPYPALRGLCTPLNSCTFCHTDRGALRGRISISVFSQIHELITDLENVHIISGTPTLTEK